jgi:hypothetical protein
MRFSLCVKGKNVAGQPVEVVVLEDHRRRNHQPKMTLNLSTQLHDRQGIHAKVEVLGPRIHLRRIVPTKYLGDLTLQPKNDRPLAVSRRNARKLL